MGYGANYLYSAIDIDLLSSILYADFHLLMMAHSIRSRRLSAHAFKCPIKMLCAPEACHFTDLLDRQHTSG